jgi:RHS repeat-associated protein
LVFAALVSAPSASAVTVNQTPLAGARKNATQVPFAVSGTAGLSVDVATGNGLFTDQLLTLPGVNGDVPITLSYNSSVWGTSTPSAVTGGTGSGWGITGFDQRLVDNGDGSFTYYGPGGTSGVFTPNGSGGFTAPWEFQGTLTFQSGTTYWLIDHASQTKLIFTGGRLISQADRNGNATTFGYDGSGNPASITSSRGPALGRLLTVHVSSGRISSLSQTSGTLSRSIGFAYSTNGHLASVTDAVSGVTGFASAYGTDTGQLVTITNPKGKTTTLSFATAGQVSQVVQFNPPIDGGAGAATTRFDYVSSTQTLTADPTTDQAQSVPVVPHTTYALTADGAMLVSSAQDPDNNTRAKTYTTGLENVATLTPAAPATGATTTLTYGANAGESLTKTATPGGATGTIAYGNTGPAQYSPSSATDDAANALNFTYNGQGDQLTTTQGTAGPQAVVTYNTDGTVATSATPGAGTGVVTTYGYDTNHDLNLITPPSGTSLGNRAYTYDGFGRLLTATDGRGNTTTYTDDNANRTTKIHSSATGTVDVSYTYNALNLLTQRVDGSGTTSYTYDDLDHLLTTANTAGGGTITYTYDLAGAVATIITGQGTTTYGYDPAHELISMAYPQGTYNGKTLFQNDANGRRTDAWLQSDTGHTAWAAHEHLSYDASGRVIGALGQNGPATTPVTALNETLCYSAGAIAPACPTTSTLDRSNVAWLSDTVTGETATFTYDTSDRLHLVTVTGGTNPRTYTYGYDAGGNRTSSSVTGSAPSSQTLTYNNANQITTTGYTYDGTGNLTAWPGHTATYNGDEQQTSTVNAAVTTTYTYAGASQNELLSEVTSGGASYSYTYGRADSHGLPEIESVKLGTSTAYVGHDPTGVPVMLQVNTSLTCLYLYDGIGNPIALANSANTLTYSVRYDPYGAVTRLDAKGNTGGWLDNPYVFHGGVQDRATGNIKFGQRFYNPTTGAWTQQDPINAPLDPHNANRYEYAGDNPVNYTDPTGNNWVGDTGVALGGIGGACAVYGGILLIPVVTWPGAAIAGACAGIAGGTAAMLGAIDYFWVD